MTTAGGEGLSLVKGVQATLQAIALSVKADGHFGSLEIGGRLATEARNVASLEVEGVVDSCTIGGGVQATGGGSDGVRLLGGKIDLDGLELEAPHGETVRRASS